MIRKSAAYLRRTIFWPALCAVLAIYFFSRKAAITTAINRKHAKVTADDILTAEKQYSQFAIDSILVENGISIRELDSTSPHVDVVASRPACNSQTLYTGRNADTRFREIEPKRPNANTFSNIKTHWFWSDSRYGWARQDRLENCLSDCQTKLTTQRVRWLREAARRVTAYLEAQHHSDIPLCCCGG